MTTFITTSSAFNGVVSALVKIAEGEVELRKHVANYVTAGGTVKQLCQELKDLDDQRCHKSLGYLKQIQNRCFTVGLLERSEKSKQQSRLPVGNQPVENPEVLSSLLPTKRDVAAYVKAPIEVKHQVVDISNSTPTPNDAIVEKVRSLINEDFEIDSSSLTEQEKDACLTGLHVRVEALTAHAAFNDQACAAAMKEYGFINSEGFWQDHKPLTTIRNLLPELSNDERKQLIDLLIPPTVDAYSDECEPSVVSMGTEADRDYDQCLEHFEQLFKISGKYITGGWTELQWHALGGECRTLEDGCNIHSSNLRKGIEQDVQGFVDSFNAAGTHVKALQALTVNS